MDLARIRDIAEESWNSLTEEQERCHEAAFKCAELLRERGYGVVVRHGFAVYHKNLLADEIEKEGGEGEFGKKFANCIRSSEMEGFITDHSWCEVGDVIVDQLPYFSLGDVEGSGPLMIHQKGEVKESEVRYVRYGFEFSLGGNHFLVVPRFSWWLWSLIVPFRLVKLKI